MFEGLTVQRFVGFVSLALGVTLFIGSAIFLSDWWTYRTDEGYAKRILRDVGWFGPDHRSGPSFTITTPSPIMSFSEYCKSESKARENMEKSEKEIDNDVERLYYNTCPITAMYVVAGFLGVIASLIQFGSFIFVIKQKYKLWAFIQIPVFLFALIGFALPLFALSGYHVVYNFVNWDRVSLEDKPIKTKPGDDEEYRKAKKDYKESIRTSAMRIEDTAHFFEAAAGLVWIFAIVGIVLGITSKDPAPAQVIPQQYQPSQPVAVAPSHHTTHTQSHHSHRGE